jgi:hypothetical protein
LELISTDLWFHVATCKTPNKIWTTLEGLFGKKDEMRGHMLEVELNTLDPKRFDNIQDFFTKFKYFLLILGECGIDKPTQEKQLILTILAKIGPEYAVYVSNFHSSRCLFGTNWKMPTLAQFIESLTQEQTKIIKMGLMKDPKAHALTMHDGKGSSKQNGNEGYSKPFNDSSGSRDSLDSKKKKKKKKGKQCTYCNKPNHEESTCMKKQTRSYGIGTSATQPWKLHSRGSQEAEGRRSCS